ncbi:MAG: alpha/beta hydrolase [Calditrichaeota bacterium]|nr:alpha/beta hydrolase [Calditrichota bacterium]
MELAGQHLVRLGRIGAQTRGFKAAFHRRLRYLRQSPHHRRRDVGLVVAVSDNLYPLRLKAPSIDSPDRYPIEDLRYQKTGAADTSVLMLHGWGGGAQSFANLSSILSTYCTIWSPSLPGFGASPEPPAVWDSFDYAEVVHRWALQHIETPFDIIAHSFGGRIAIALAARHPDLVRCLILISSAGLKQRRTLPTRMKIAGGSILRLAGELCGGRIKEALNRRRERLGSADWRAASPIMRDVLSRVINEDLTDCLRRVQAPTMLIWGTEDTATPLRMAEKMLKLLSKAELVKIPKAGHFCYLDAPSEALSAIWKHLSLPKAW